NPVDLARIPDRGGALRIERDARRSACVGQDLDIDPVEIRRGCRQRDVERVAVAVDVIGGGASHEAVGDGGADVRRTDQGAAGAGGLGTLLVEVAVTDEAPAAS